MRNDARPIGEQFRDIAEHDRPAAGKERGAKQGPAERAREKDKPFVTNRDPGDEEAPPDTSQR
jgi:hypothetical protein